MFRRMTIGQRIMAGFCVALITLMGFGGMTLLAFSRIDTAAHSVGTIYLPSMTAIGDMQGNLARMRVRQLRYLAAEAPEALAEGERLIESSRKAIQKAMTAYENLPDISSDKERAAWDELTKSYDEYTRLSTKLMSLTRDGMYEAAHTFEKETLRPVYNAVATAADTVQTENAAAASSAMLACTTLVTQERRTGTILIAVAVLLCAAAASVTTRAISRPVRDLTATARAVAAGDYDHKTHNDHLYGGELQDLLQAVRAMVGTIMASMQDATEKSAEAAKEAEAAQHASEAADAARAEAEAQSRKLAQAVADLQTVMERLSSSSEELAAQVEQSSRGAEEQARRVAETATAIEEMNATVLEVARNAEDAAQHANQARKEAEQGADIVNEVVAAMSGTSAKAGELKEDMAGLEQQAMAIGRIMTVISDIADQTNLLALNAAIEAARAGEAGRGFAVVADEVRKLAEKTMHATHEVGAAIKGIQTGTELSIHAADDVVGRIGTLSHKVRASGEALNRIVAAVQAATGEVSGIATASSQQSAASDEIAHSVEDINRISSETAEAMRQSSIAVTELASQAQNLEGLISRMNAREA
ncbi:methyl-accepting chemotaxis protein [Nitratidesulfovibrio vulgaris]|uniref:methyl-accepting chemotaxis protein n=1 Tax=Nitratidesulfovibrio vulgaris TaxID=881 RepID=UPI002301880A|nr:HAMP domain-containing methyl-accepting chemotaxis protein [Nitratidesulfovibrio vulgaris]WCB46921.1 HAMP domain-containing methyl-accepting chemotaxis protein [Nitratidesulfovibrio vulgaris]